MRRLVVLVLLTGCAEFPTLNLGVCRNGIVEAGEDCDDKDDESCTDDCRRICDPRDPTPDCAPGQVCGDGICRAPSDRFLADPVRIPEEGALWIETGDFDGDGRQDLAIQFDEPDLKVVYFEPPLAVELVELAEGVVTQPAITDLTGDGADDLFVVHEAATTGPNAVSLWSGVVNSHRPRLGYFATLKQVGSDSRLLSPASAPDRILELVTPQQTKHWSSQVFDAVEVDPVGIGGAGLGTSVAVGDVDGGQCEDVHVFPRQEVALAVAGETMVRIASTCGGGDPFEFLPSVTLPQGRLGPAGAFFARVAGDDYVDLITQDEDGRVYVAYGAGDGTFSSDPAATDGRFAATPLLGKGTALLKAVADFDLDGELEFATEERYYPCLDDGCAPVTWALPMTSAAVVDINANGIPDLAAADDDGLVVRLSNPDDVQLFNEHRVDVAGPVRDLVVGDFNRDTIEDIAYIEVDEEAEVAPETVTVLFGAPGGTQWAVEALGPFADVEDLVVEAGGTLVARTVDDEGRPAGAFIRLGEPRHSFGLLGHAPQPVSLGKAGTAVVGVLAPSGEQSEAVGHYGFVGASLSPHDIRSGTPLGLAPGDGAALISVAVDLDGDDVEELVVLGDGRGWTSRHDPTTGTWVSAEFSHGAAFRRAAVDPDSDARPTLGPGSVAATGDVDGDGDLDVVATTDAAHPVVAVFRNDGGVLASTPVMLTNPTKPGFEFAQLRRWHERADGIQRWLVAGPEGVGIADIDLDARRIEVHDNDIIEAHYVALATGDLDGDGLLDLVVATRREVRIHLAVEQRGAVQ